MRRKFLFPLVAFIVICFPLNSQANVIDSWEKQSILFLDNTKYFVTFNGKEGKIVLAAKSETDLKKEVQIFFLGKEKMRYSKIVSCKISDDTENDRKIIQTIFAYNEKSAKIDFIFNENGDIEIKPVKDAEEIRIIADIAFGIVPSHILDDLIYDPGIYSSGEKVSILPENIFLGLLDGKDGMIMVSWPSDSQSLKAFVANKESINSFNELTLGLSGNTSIFLKIIAQEGVWHKQAVLPSYLEKDVKIDWIRPFNSKWKTKIPEIDEIESDFGFKNSRSEIWRPVLGYYVYPFWFEGKQTMVHFSKKVPPPQSMLIYTTEGNERTALKFLKNTIGRTRASEAIKIMSQQPYPSNGVGIQHCDGRDWVKRIFKVGLQYREREFLNDVFDDFLYSINVQKNRLQGYEDLIRALGIKTTLFYEKNKNDADLSSFFLNMKGQVEDTDKKYWKITNRKTIAERLAHETNMINKLKILSLEQTNECYLEAVYLLGEIQIWTFMETVPAEIGAMLRYLASRASYECVDKPQAVKYALEIREDIRKFFNGGVTFETIQ